MSLIIVNNDIACSLWIAADKIMSLPSIIANNNITDYCFFLPQVHCSVAVVDDIAVLRGVLTHTVRALFLQMSMTIKRVLISPHLMSSFLNHSSCSW